MHLWRTIIWLRYMSNSQWHKLVPSMMCRASKSPGCSKSWYYSMSPSLHDPTFLMNFPSTSCCYWISWQCVCVCAFFSGLVFISNLSFFYLKETLFSLFLLLSTSSIVGKVFIFISGAFMLSTEIHTEFKPKITVLFTQ